MFYFKSFILNFLAAKKLQKAPARGKNSLPALCLRVASDIPQSSRHCLFGLFPLLQGVAELDLRGYSRKYIPAQIFKQSSHNGLQQMGPPLCFSTVPVFLMLPLPALRAQCVCVYLLVFLFLLFGAPISQRSCRVATEGYVYSRLLPFAHFCFFERM